MRSRFPRVLVALAAATASAAVAGCLGPKTGPAGGVRPTYDRIGFAQTPEQIEAIVRESEVLESETAPAVEERLRDLDPVGVVCPHDDHLYAGRVYIHVLPRISGARTVVLFGVTHRKARELLGDPQGVVILDDYDSWQGPYGPVEVDVALRERLRRDLFEGGVLVSREGHANEHSIEAMIPFLQHANRSVRIVPVMVTGMPFEEMEALSGRVASSIATYAREEGLALGRDLAFVVSSDAVHYGPDFDYDPYGVDEYAADRALGDDVWIAMRCLAGEMDRAKLAEFTETVWGEGIPWCGRYSVPFGLLVMEKVARTLSGEPLFGVRAKYSTSRTLGVLPVATTGTLGTTAPASLEHWVGYWGIVYGIPRS
jgi:AmmeMemoRadiSam system protein B